MVECVVASSVDRQIGGFFSIVERYASSPSTHTYPCPTPAFPCLFSPLLWLGDVRPTSAAEMYMCISCTMYVCVYVH